MKKPIVVVVVVGLLAVAGMSYANTVASSTMYFQGTLTDDGSGGYTGTLPAQPGYYYVSGGPGAGIATNGGFDVYAKEGGTAYVSCYTPKTNAIGSDHDAYNKTGLWGAWYDPDVEDYYNFSLVLTAGHWELQHKGGGTQAAPTGGIPMGGPINWSTMIATETDLGWHPAPGNSGDAQANGGGASAWDCDWTWGSEVIPLQWGSFDVQIVHLGGGEVEVALAPHVPEPLTMLGMFLGLGSVGAYIRKRRMA